MGIVLQATYRQGTNKSVPAPWDAANSSKEAWYDHVARAVPAMAAFGVTAILLPPICKTQSGDQITGDGYGKFDDYDIGSKDQCGSIATRFGTREQLLRLCAVAAANGVDILLDVVLHQYAGGDNGTYTYAGADGRTKNGRFPKKPSYFWAGGTAEHDVVPAPQDDFGFGNACSYIKSLPTDELAKGAIAAGDWAIRTTGAVGGRIDDTKGLNAGFVRRYVTSAAMAGKYWFGEFDDGNRDLVNAWVENSIFANGVQGTCSGEDFPLHYVVEYMANNTTNWDMRQLDHAGLQGINPMKALTFVENPDTDTDGFGTVVFNKAQAYAAIMFGEGLPCIYWKDWSSDAGCYGGGGLKPNIENVAWINARLAGGPTICRHKEYQFIISERTGGAGLLWGINNDQWNEHGAWVQTAFGPNVQLHDYSGHAGDVWTNADGWAYIGLPRNDNGLGYVAYSRVGHEGDLPKRGRAITQVTFGASDLDIGPLKAGETTLITRLWCAANTDIRLSIKADETDIVLAVTGPDNLTVGRVTDKGSLRTDRDGWHGVYGMSKVTTSYEMTATYTAPKSIGN